MAFKSLSSMNTQWSSDSSPASSSSSKNALTVDYGRLHGLSDEICEMRLAAKVHDVTVLQILRKGLPNNLQLSTAVISHYVFDMVQNIAFFMLGAHVCGLDILTDELQMTNINMTHRASLLIRHRRDNGGTLLCRQG